jgi:hypothetical protein
MIAELYEAAFVQHHDAVGMHNRRQTVVNDQRGLPALATV